MRQRKLGRSGLLVSEVGIGCNNFGHRLDFEGTKAVVHAALDLGITLFDTADVYARPHRGRSEEYLGEILGPRRQDVVLATKFGGQMSDDGRLKGGSRRYVMQAAEASLRRLKTDWIDLYQFHRPDPLTPIEETLRALEDLIRQGKVRYIGVSNMKPWQVADAVWTGRQLGLSGIVSCQDEYSLLSREPDAGLLDAMQHYGLGLLPYFPLASGMLTGKYRRGALPNAGVRLVTTPLLRDHFLTEANLAAVEKLQAFCDARGRGMVELAFSWLLARPCVASVIAGASNRAQLEQNIAATGWALSAEEMAELDAISPPPGAMVHV
jgi:aryl-alcohol dehydrogenase-like predicted oxidoreductase